MVNRTRRAFALLAGALVWVVGLGGTRASSAPETPAEWPTFRGGGGRNGSADGKELPRRLRELWRFDGKDYRSPSIASSPAVVGGTVYIGVAEQSVFRLGGRVVSLEAATGKKRWEFETHYPVFSSPAVAAGRLFVGEGFHQDSRCRLYALESDTGKLLWDVETESHVESSPHVEGDRVYFGAGNDGIYCLESKTGKEIWHLEDLHVDISPLVSSGRLFAGTGYGRTAALCVDASSGKLLWQTPVDVPVWGSPVRLGNRVYFGLGNGNFLESAERPKGGVLCLSATSGKQVWRTDLPDAVLTAVAAAGRTLYVGSRDGRLYALSSTTGKTVWKHPCGGAVVASPLVAARGRQVVAATVSGRLVLVDGASGEEVLRLEVSRLLGTSEEIGVFSSPVAHDGRLLVGTRSGVLLSLGEAR